MKYDLNPQDLRTLDNQINAGRGPEVDDQRPDDEPTSDVPFPTLPRPYSRC